MQVAGADGGSGDVGSGGGGGGGSSGGGGEHELQQQQERDPTLVATHTYLGEVDDLEGSLPLLEEGQTYRLPVLPLDGEAPLPPPLQNWVRPAGRAAP